MCRLSIGLFLLVLPACGASVQTDGGAVVDAGGADGGLDAMLAEQVDAIISRYVGNGQGPSRCPSVVAVVVLPGRTVVRGYGQLTDSATDVPGPDSVFPLGSVTKVFTGVALAQLVLDGGLSARGDVRDVLKTDLAGALDASVRLEQLASHTARFPNYPPNPTPSSPLSPFGSYSRAELGQALSTLRQIDAGFSYSNLGTGLLAVALEDATDAGSYHALLRTLVTAPLSMDDTWGQVWAIPDAGRARLAQGHFAADGGWRGASELTAMGVLAGSGEAATTGNDFARFLRALAGIDVTVLEPALKLAMTPVVRVGARTEIGYLLGIEHRDGGDVFSKAGHTMSSSSYLVVERSALGGVGVGLLAGCDSRFPIEDAALELFDAVGRRP